ncbi:hypothetical protein IL306_005768 [Fusarium sp. DS 682]|nr:hypothetical protein IL306_005768 [Fusarium sp. DS 682]
MADFATLSVTTRALIDNWQMSILETQDLFPATRPDASAREPTIIPPPLPVKQKMNEFAQYQRVVKRNINILQRLMTNNEQRVRLMDLVALSGSLETTTIKIQMTIWDLDPDRYNRELLQTAARLRQTHADLDDLDDRRANDPANPQRFVQEMEQMQEKVDQTSQEVDMFSHRL